jgi:hypothetical protein
MEEGKLPPFLLLLKVVGLLVLSPKTNELVLVIAYIDLSSGHSRKVINSLFHVEGDGMITMYLFLTSSCNSCRFKAFLFLS